MGAFTLEQRMIATASSTVSAEPFTVRADNGYELTGTLWRGSDSELSLRPVTIINAATSVRCRYYSRFAEFLVSRGCDVITYDYRGIGVSRPATLRGFDASWIDWGKLDFEAVLCFAARNFGGQPIDVVGHSIGGFVIGLAPSCQRE